MNLHAKHATAQEERKKVVVFTNNKFKRMDIDSIIISTTWSFLMVVVFVYVSIYPFQMKKKMKESVKEIINNEESRQRKH